MIYLVVKAKDKQAADCRFKEIKAEINGVTKTYFKIDLPAQE